MEDLLVTETAWFEITPVSLTITGRPTFAQWEGLFTQLRAIQVALPWYVGDMLVQGEGLFGETYAQAVEATGYQAQTLMNYASVCRRVPKERRSESLSFSHHALIAAEPATEQSAWIQEAETKSLSTAELREEVHRMKDEQAPAYEVELPFSEPSLIAVYLTEQELIALATFLDGFTAWTEIEEAAVQKIEEARLAL